MTEILAVKEGKARVRVDGRDMVLGPGQSVVVRPGQVHQFWNEGEGRLVLMTEDRPPGRHRAMFELMHRLDCAGKTNKQRIPTNPLLLALLMERTDAYLPGLPVMLQKLIFGSLAGLARLVGYEYKWAREPGDPVRVRRSAVVEASAIVPLGPEETWDMLLGEQIPRLVEMPGMSVVAVEDYRMRPDGTPRYTMANKVGPVTVRHTADFSVYERPHRSVNRVLDNPFGGTLYGTYEPVSGGTQVKWRWEVEPQNLLAGVLMPIVRPLLERSMQHDLEALAKVP